MSNNTVEQRRNASASWSGYIHQGKVGFLVALRELKNYIQDEVPDYGGYNICYENAEDFDIVNNEGRVISRHQVKAYKQGEKRETYSELFCIQTREFNNGQVKILRTGFQIHKFNEEGDIVEIEVDEAARFIHTVVEVPDFYLSEDAYFSKHQRRTEYTPNDSKVKLYPYSEIEEFCPLSTNDNDDRIRDYCIDEIKDILTKLNSVLKDNSNHFKQVYYKYIASILDNSIGVAHQESAFPSISFELLCSLLTTEIPEDDIYQAKNNLIYIWDEYKHDLEDDLSNGVLETVDSIIKDLLCKEKSEFEKIVRKLAPHEALDKKISIILNDAVLKKILFYIFSELEYFDSNNITYYDKEKHSYRTSVIAINETPAQISNVIKKIIRNKEFLERSFDNRYLINDSISGILINESVYGFPEDSSPINYKDEWNTGVTDSIFNADMEFINTKKAIECLKQE